jgi:hypothetical protein
MEEVRNNFALNRIEAVNSIDDTSKIVNAKAIVVKLVIINLVISVLLYSIYLIF